MDLVILLACTQPAPETAPTPNIIDPIRVFTRASLDLRGTRPQIAELEQLKADPSQLNAQLLTLADNPQFGGRVASFFEPLWQTRAEAADVALVDYAMPDESAFLSSVGEEPLQIITWIADHDLPWTDIVQADWTMADPTLAAVWPVDYPAGQNGWQNVHYTDGRPMAGVLSSNGLWWRYTSTFNNANRGRASTLARILFCQDFLEIPVPFDPMLDLTDEMAVQDAIHSNPSCVACHSNLDPAGAYLWGFFTAFTNDPTDWAHYHPDREQNWETFGVAPGWYGTPGSTLKDMGAQMADDPRLIQCVVKRSYEAMLQREAGLADTDALTQHREKFIEGGVQLRALYRSLVLDPQYQQVGPEDAPAKLLSPDLLASTIEDLTGFRLSFAGHDAFREDWYGLRAMAGGSRSTRTPIPEPTPTLIEVQERLAQAAADYVVQQDHQNRSSPRLFAAVDPGQPVEDTQILSQLQALHQRVLSEFVENNDPMLQEELSLWHSVFAETGSTTDAWAAVLGFLMRDPRFLVY